MFTLSSDSTADSTSDEVSSTLVAPASSSRLYSSYEMNHRTSARKMNCGDTTSIADSEDSSAAPSPSFQLPLYLSSPSRRTRSSLSSSTSSSSSSSGNSQTKEQEDKVAVQRLILLAKYPTVNEAQAQQTLHRQQRKEMVATAIAMKKGEAFRQQERMKEQRLKNQEDPQSQLTKSRTLKQRTRRSIETSALAEEEVEEVDDHLQIVFQPPIPSSSQSPPTVRSNSVGGDAASFVVWRSTGQGIGEAVYEEPPSLQRITFREEHSQDQHDRYLEEHPAKRSGIIGLGAALFRKISLESSQTPPSSGASIRSESLDGRSINTASKSIASKASLPSYCSESTRKINNLTPKDQIGDHLNSINEDEQNGKGGFRRLVSTRNGFIILILMVILLFAIIVTISAALAGSKKELQDHSKLGDDPFPVLSRTEAPGFPPTISIPSLPSNDASMASSSMGETLAPTFSDEFESTSEPSEISLSPTTQPITPLTAAPTFSPYSSPSSSPSVSPTLAEFSNRTWTQRGLSFQGSEPGEQYGRSVAISDNGRTLAIGAPYSTVDGKSKAGIVQIYQWDDNDRRGWIALGVLQGRNTGDQFGSNIAHSADGTVIAVSEPTYRGQSGDRSGNVRVFVHNPFSGYSPLGQELEGADATDHFGIGLSVSADGRRLAIGAPYHDTTDKNGNGKNNGTETNRLVSGRARVFEWSREEGRWLQVGQPLDGDAHLDWFGWSIDLNEDGSAVCVGAPRNLEYGGYVKCFEEVRSRWTLLGDPIQNNLHPVRYDDNFGTSVKLSWNRSKSRHRAAIGSPGKNYDATDAGVAVVYEFDPQKSSTGWTQIGQTLVSVSPSERNRMATSLDLRGDLLVVGIPGASEVNLFRYIHSNGRWERHPRPLQGLPGSNFGTAVSITPHGDVAVGSSQSGDGTDIGVVNVYGSTLV